MISYDAELQLHGKGLIAIGVDEAGRGALAGPVVAAAVVLQPDRIPVGINDSKKLSASQRAALAEEIRQYAQAWAIGWRSSQRIDEINILQATYEAMHEAIDQCLERIGKPPESYHLLIDGNRFRQHAVAHTTIVSGDSTCLSIAAASILAKTWRDEVMVRDLDPLHSEYGFARHKGYGTLYHREALHRWGACACHRQSFIEGILRHGTQPRTEQGSA